MGRLRPMGENNEATDLLQAWGGGDRDAFDRLMLVLQDELRGIAHRYMAGERPDHTLETRALVNEMYLRLVKRKRVSWKNSDQFRAFAAKTMRRVLVDHARKRQAKIRNEGVRPMPIDELRDMPDRRDRELIALDDAMRDLEKLNERQHSVVELHYFGGLTCAEIGEVMDFAEITGKRDLRAGRAWLERAMKRPEPGSK